ncbi:MAG TPA: NDP-sugar synthase [Actinomycetota bacterium]|nr:NDP-sugar synthase [Actinomycetota bacterium]
MKAVLLVGGEGTRLRPLTETIPKPLIPLVDRPFLGHVFDHLGRYGVEEVLLSSPYLEDVFAEFLARNTAGPTVKWIPEPTPLGTGGAVANAARDLEETFIVLNGDILTDLDLSALVAHHRTTGATATITLSSVVDARPYGLVTLDEEGRVQEFTEKPTEAVPGLVNAGTYVLEPNAIHGVPRDRPVSIEREIFPGLIASGAMVQAFVSQDYWMDLGTPEKYLQATFDALDGKIGGLQYAAPHVDPRAEISIRSHLGRWVVAGPGARIGAESLVEDSVLLAGAVVQDRAKVTESILGPGAMIGADSIVQGAVLAEGASIPPGTSSEGARVGAGQVFGS